MCSQVKNGQKSIMSLSLQPSNGSNKWVSEFAIVFDNPFIVLQVNKEKQSCTDLHYLV